MKLQLGSFSVEERRVRMQLTLILDPAFKVDWFEVWMIFQAEESSKAEAEIVLFDHGVALYRTIEHDVRKDFNVATRLNEELIDLRN